MNLVQSPSLIDTGPILLFTGPHAFLSNFYAHTRPFVYQGELVWSAERAYQASKSVDPDERAAIWNAPTSFAAWKYGRDIEYPAYTPVEWDNAKMDVMEGVLWAKFQDAELAELLVGTGDRELVEGTLGSDRFWAEQIVPANNNDGYERTGRGSNYLGILLMALREGLRV